mmetsp:Transcript_6275/g.11215  ORF Transcript_6275/g.11215 Transcript_6275/m.11215 type:complete len:374 (-) Transcript_6275:57-1178(-)
MLLACNYLHHVGITHRDLKLENFLYDEAGSKCLKLIDFGLSKFSRAKRMNQALGTLTYTAPEVLKRDYAHASCDLWSLGCITFILLFGYMPFNASTDTDLVHLIVRGRYAERRKQWEKVSAVGQDFVRKLLVVDPAKRMTAKQSLAHPWIASEVKSGMSGLDHRSAQAFLSLARASEFKRACLKVMAWSLPLPDRKSLSSHFIACGETRDGIVELHHLEQLFCKELKLPAGEVHAVMCALKELNAQGRNELHYSDFLAGMMAKRLEQQELCDELLKGAFHRFEVPGQGFVTPESVQVLVGGDVRGLEDAFDETLAETGRMNEAEFMAFMRNPSHVSSTDVCYQKKSEACWHGSKRRRARHAVAKLFSGCVGGS